MNTNATLMHRFKARLKNFVHQMCYSTRNPHLVGRDHDHLASPYRRVLTAPDLAQQQLVGLLFNDEHFLSALGEAEGKLLVRACLIGDQICANVFRLERFPNSPLTAPFDDDWRKSNIIHYLVDLRYTDEDVLTRRITALTHDGLVDADLSYDFYEPMASYIRTLTHEENLSVSSTTRPSWKKLS